MTARAAMELTTLLKDDRADHDVSTATLLSGKQFALTGPDSKLAPAHGVPSPRHIHL